MDLGFLVFLAVDLLALWFAIFLVMTILRRGNRLKIRRANKALAEGNVWDRKQYRFQRWIRERFTPATDRGLGEYCAEFGVYPDYFSKKTVLDVGAGSRGSFAGAVREAGGKVFSLNPKLRRKIPRIMAKTSKWKNWQSCAVAGVAEELPYRDKTFDIVVSLWCVPVWMENKDELMQAVREMFRVARSPGEMLLAPVPTNGMHDFLLLLKEHGYRTEVSRWSMCIKKP